MTTKLNPYLNFRDTARDAMEFYRDIFGGDLTVMTFGDMGAEDASADLVMHAALVTSSGFTLFASDLPPGMELSPGGSITVSVSGAAEDEAELRGYWDRLAAGATVHMPLEKQMWGDLFGHLVDQYGTPWMLNIGQDTA